MIIHIVPYEWIERLFGTYIANHFNKISFGLLLFGFMFWALFIRGSEKKKTHNDEPSPMQNEIPYRIDEEGHIVPDLSKKPKKVPYTKEATTGESYYGQFDRYSDLSDEEMKLAMQIRVDRNNPTFEEWKAQREQDIRKCSPSNSSPQSCPHHKGMDNI